MRSLRRALLAFVRLSRPLFLYAGVAGFALGAAVARAEHYRIDAAAYLSGQLLVTAFQLMVHFANDYFDREPDGLTVRTRVSGGSGMLVDGSLAPRTAFAAAVACASAGCAGVVFVAIAGSAAAAILGVAIGVLAWSYSAPPVRLCARGWGEVDTVAVVAVLVPIFGFTCFAATIDGAALAATIPGALAMFAMMLGVGIPDVAADAATAKRTLVVRWGVVRTRTVIRWCAIVAMVALLILVMVVAHATSALPNAAWLVLTVIVPAAVAIMLALQPRSVARSAVLGVALYATTVTAVLGAYALKPTSPPNAAAENVGR